MVSGLVLVVAGVSLALLSLSRSWRSFLAGRLAAQTGVRVGRDQTEALETRMGHLGRGQGLGIAVAGVVLLLWGAVADGGASGDPYLVIALMLVLGAAGLALAEILRPHEASGGTRAARARAPGVADYIPLGARALTWAITCFGLLVLIGTLLLTRSRWFDASTIMTSPVPLLVVSVPVLALLSVLAVRRVLDTPQPARDEDELFWQDIIRGRLIAALIAPVALVSLFAVLVSGTLLDAAASAAVAGTDQVGPAWSLWLLIAGYLVPVVVVVIAATILVAERGHEAQHIRIRLWGGRPGGAPSAEGI